MTQTYFKDYRSYLSFCPDRLGKSTLFENENMLVGLNCLEPGQSFDKHAHEAQNRFYLVLEGRGCAYVGDTREEFGPGTVIWIPLRNTHKVENTGTERVVMLVGIAPAPGE